MSGWRAGGFLSGNARRAEQENGYSRGGPVGPMESVSAPVGGRKGGGGWVKDLSSVLCFVSQA